MTKPAGVHVGVLISQARALGTPIVSADSAFEAYEVEVLAIR